jgi:enterochelin esterase-like enzyme
MKKLLTICSLLFIFLGVTQAADEVRIFESLSFYSKILGQPIKFSVVLPENYYSDNQKYPVVYLLHGLGDDETAWIEYGRINQVADKAIRNSEISPMIFVIPQGFRTYYVNDYEGKFRYQDMFTQELIPQIDSMYRTIAKNTKRAVMGYSMGGFGALILALKNPQLISITVPLSISIRTDEQYMEEDASEWDKQWGSLFGGVGMKGKDRITEYYKQNCAFHIFADTNPEKFKGLKILIDNGDDEHTLCRSNEELHILMREKSIPHEFRVRDGGHSFDYWYSALPVALRFISDAFESKPYRGDKKSKTEVNNGRISEEQLVSLNNEEAFAYFPAEYQSSQRLYPVIYFADNFTTEERKSLANSIFATIERKELSPLILVFLNENSLNDLSQTIPVIENKLRIRKGYRFRAIAGTRGAAQIVCKASLGSDQFSTVILSDAFLEKDSVTNYISAFSSDFKKHSSLFIDAPDKGKYYQGNGNLHMLLRDKDFDHEYRVREGNGGFGWTEDGMQEIVAFIIKRFHK